MNGLQHTWRRPAIRLATSRAARSDTFSTPLKNASDKKVFAARRSENTACKERSESAKTT